MSGTYAQWLARNLLLVTESDWPTYLRDAMTAAGFERPVDLARASGVSDSIISKWLAGAVQPSIPQLRRISSKLNVPVLALVVAAGHLSPKEAQLKDVPVAPKAPAGDEIEREIKAAGYPPETEKALLKMRQDSQAQLRDVIDALRRAGVLTPKAKTTGN